MFQRTRQLQRKAALHFVLAVVRDRVCDPAFRDDRVRMTPLVLMYGAKRVVLPTVSTATNATLHPSAT